MGASGLALATSVSGILGACMLFVRLRGKLGKMGARSTLYELIKIGICTAVCMLVCLVMDKLLPQASGSVTAFVRLGVGALVSMIVYAGCALVVGVRPVNELKGMVKRLVKRG